MIFTDRTIIVQKGTSSINDTIILYRGDKGVEIRFTLNEGSPFRFGSGASPNIIEKTEAAYGQLIIKRPNDLPAVFSEIAPTNGGKIVFTITAEMIDEITEVGNYTFQIRLLDESRNSRATLPEVVNGIEIREPIATEDVTDTNEVGVATVGYALTTAGTTEDAFDSQGNYNKTTWVTGDRITASELNKIEAGIDGVNKKVASGGTGGQGMTAEQAQQLSTAYQHSQSAHVQASDIPTKTSDLNNDSNFVNETYVTNAINNAQLGGSGQEVDLSIYQTKTDNTLNTTDKTVVGAINEIKGNMPTGGGLSNNAITLLISILRSGVYTSDQSANITALQGALGSTGSGGGSDSPTTQYTITNTLDNATTSNTAVLVDANASYSATITVNDGYSLDTITVTMGGADITSTAVSGNTITISAVTGNVVITVTTTATSSGGGSSELVTDGLVNFFDFRTATYNNSGAGGSTIISATQGNGSLYAWANNAVRAQDEYGITQANSRSWAYNGSSVGTTTTSLGTSFTVIFKCYLTGTASPLFDKGYGMSSNVNKIVYVPKYKTTSGTGNAANTELGTRKDSGYDTVTLIVDGNICKLYFGTELMQTNDGSTISDFQGWHDQLTGISILGDYKYGHLTQLVVYNKALSEVELVDTIDYLATLEVK